jgi:hypothetical protein
MSKGRATMKTNPDAPRLEDMSIMPTMLEPPLVSAPSMSLSLGGHPLLRGLLLELPAKGTLPAPGWLDRWFEATRSDLDLLCQQQAAGGQQRR